MDGNLTARLLARDLGLHPAAFHAPLLLERAPGKVKTGESHGVGVARGSTGHGSSAHGTSTHGTTAHGTDTAGGDGSTRERDLALAATWQVDPALLQPQPGDSAATVAARARLAAVAGHLKIVMGRYDQAHTAAMDAASTAVKARADLQEARANAAAAHRVYVRDHRLLVQLVNTSYEQGPLTSIQFLLAADSVHDLMVGMGTMQQVASNQASLVTDAEAATAKMRETAVRAHIAEEHARIADHRAHHTLAAATAAGRKVLDQLDKARRVLTLSVLADQMQT
ncbi:MAG: hypothetical protein ACTHJ6_13500, partial [Oryzihumus sp.]